MYYRLSPTSFGKSPEMHVCAIIHAREIRYIVEFGLLVVVRSSRDQLISIVENSSGLKRRIYCDVFLQLTSLKIDTRAYICPFDTMSIWRKFV